MAIRGKADVDRISRTPYKKRGWPETSYTLIERAAQRWPDRIALTWLPDPADIDRARDYRYQDLFGAVTRAANLFAGCGAERHTVVAHALPNLPQTHFCRWGAEAVCTGLGINPALDTDEIIALLVTSKAGILVADASVWERLVERLPEACPLLTYVFLVGDAAAIGHPDVTVQHFDTAMANQPGDRLIVAPSRPSHDGSWFCTGGTTGPPKIARRTLAAETFNAMVTGMMLGNHLREDSVLLSGMPLFHVNSAISTGLMPWTVGARVVLAGPAGFANPDLVTHFWRIVERYRVSLCMAAPYVYAMLLKQPIGRCDIGSLELCVAGAAPFPSALQRRFEAATGLRVLAGYGVTEASFTVTVNPVDGQRRDGSVGISLPWQQIRIVELDARGNYLRDCHLGEIGWVLMSGDQLFEGYAGDTVERGIWVDCGDGQRWFNSSDLGHMDADGYLWLVGRREDLIIRHGLRIEPGRIEEPLMRHPMVSAAVVVGRPDPAAGELPVAWVQLRKGGQSDSDALLAYLRDEVERPEHLPVAVRIVDALPLTPVGRIYRLGLVAEEIRDIVQTSANAVGVPLDSIDVRASNAFGKVVTIEGAGNPAALKEALRGYAFYPVVRQ